VSVMKNPLPTAYTIHVALYAEVKFRVTKSFIVFQFLMLLFKILIHYKDAQWG